MIRIERLGRPGTALACLLGLAACVEGPVEQAGGSVGLGSGTLGYAGDTPSLSRAAPTLKFAPSPVSQTSGLVAPPFRITAEISEAAAAQSASPLLARLANVPLPPARPLDASAGTAYSFANLKSAPQLAAAASAVLADAGVPVAVPVARAQVQLASLFVEGARIGLPAQQALDQGNIIGRQTQDVVTSCFPENLKAVLVDISQHFGGKPVIVTSGFRSDAHNRHSGGAGHSFHTRCLAADFQIDGVAPASIAHYARTLDSVGGVGRYGHTKSVHVDVGERKFSWFGLHRRHRRA